VGGGSEASDDDDDLPDPESTAESGLESGSESGSESDPPSGYLAESEEVEESEDFDLPNGD